MGRRPGSKNKPKDVDGSVVVAEPNVSNAPVVEGGEDVEDVVVDAANEPVVEDDVKSDIEVVKNEEKKEEPKKAVPVKPILEPLGVGQAYFEAPDGTILIGESSKPHLWYRAGNDGKGMWINPKR